MKFKNISEVASKLKASEERVREVMAINSIAIEDIDETMIEAMRQELDGAAIAPAKTAKPTKQGGAIAPVSPVTPAPITTGTKTTRQAAADALLTPDRIIRETIDEATQRTNEALLAQKEATVSKLSTEMIAASTAQLEGAANFLLQALRSETLMDTLRETAETTGWVEGELV